MSKSTVDQELVDIFVRKVMGKHKFKSIENDHDKTALKELVTKLQSQVEQFIEQQEKTYTEANAPKSSGQSSTPSTQGESSIPKRNNKKIIQSENNVKNLKLYKSK